MDIAGAEALARRLQQQEHWRQARSVRVGLQPSCDPDGHALESCGPGLRVYRAERRVELYEGRTAMVRRRLEKRLIDGAWEGELTVEGVYAVA
jgi:hypothetical protein